MKSGSSYFSFQDFEAALAQEEEAGAEEEFHKEGEEICEEESDFFQEDDNAEDFPIELLRDIANRIYKEANIQGLDEKIIKEFHTLLDQKKFIGRKVNFTDKKVIEVVKNMIRRTSIPGPGDELYNDLYKVLVRNLSNELKDANTNELDAEVTARKLAAWVLKFDQDIKGKNQQEKNQSINDKEEQSLPDNPFYYKPSKDGGRDGDVKLYNLTEKNSKPYWDSPGQVVELQDRDGSQIYVKGLPDREGQKTLVKKIRKTNRGNEVSSWVVEVADREDKKPTGGNVQFRIPNDKPDNLKMRPPDNVDEWKTIADIRRDEAMDWKRLLGTENPKAGNENTRTDRGQTNANKNLIDLADLNRGFKSIRKLNLIKDAEKDVHLIEELKKRSLGANLKVGSWRKNLSS